MNDDDFENTLKNIRAERDKMKAEVEFYKNRNIRMEKIEQLLGELEYHIAMGVQDNEIPDHLTMRKIISKNISLSGKTHLQLEVTLKPTNWYSAGSGSY